MTFDLLFIVALAALIVGPRKAVEMGKDFGRWKAKFAALTGDLRSTLEQEFKALEAETPSLQAPSPQLDSPITSVAPVRENRVAENGDNEGVAPGNPLTVAGSTTGGQFPGSHHSSPANQ